MQVVPITNKAYALFHEGCLALSQVEANGIRIDTDYLAKAKVECKGKIAKLKASLLADPVYAKWRRRFGAKTNLGSREQLGEVVFGIMEYPCLEKTKTGRPSTDDEAMRAVKLPFVQNYLESERWKKALNTYLKGIEREVCDGYLHPVFNLHIPVSFRGSSDSPNFQNQPIRNPAFAKLIRSAFVPRAANRQIVEFDFKGIEVSIAACYNHDPVLIAYVSDPTKDMHGDMGRQCYIVAQKQMTKLIRYCAKNGFVFPEFYGNWYKAVAKDLWTKISEMKLVTADGTPLREHLRKHGIKGLGKCDPEQDAMPGTFEYHIKEVEDDFWHRRFKVYDQWKKEWNQAYVEKGYFDMLTGFRCSTIMDRKQVVNYPVQGSAFHCLLWSLIRVQKLLRKYRLKSLVVGQIHDSMIMDVLVREMKDVMEIVKQVTTIDLAQHWSWICVPLRIEAEASPAGQSWYLKKEVAF
jgi:DNA polymerase-1